MVTAQPILDGMTSFFIVRTEQPAMVAGAIRRTIKAAVLNVATGREIVARDIGRQRLGAWFFSGFGLAALLLGIGGAFGLVAYLAESQRREFGVRLALGANMGHLVRRGLAAALVPVARVSPPGCSWRRSCRECSRHCWPASAPSTPSPTSPWR